MGRHTSSSLISQEKTQEVINAYDIETYKEGDLFAPFCVCFSINKAYFSFYGDSCVINSLISIFKNIRGRIIIYVHNLDFDGFLILEEVSKNSKFKLDFLIHKMKIYYLKVIFMSRIIEFRCSQKILPSSLKKIARDFNLKEKMPYPYTFVDKTRLYYYSNLEWDGYN